VNLDTSSALNFVIRIEKLATQSLRHLAAQCRLAGTHQSNKKDIGFRNYQDG
jgi:hypothetical protein